MDLPEDLASDFAEFLNDAAGAHAYALDGLRLAREHWSRTVAESVDPDAPVRMGIPDVKQGAIEYQRWRLSSIPDRLGPEGPVAQLIGQQWIIMVYTRWDNIYRRQVATHLGLKDQKKLEIPIFGDLRRMRNDAAHGGVATAEWTGHCEILSHWFSVGDVLMIDPAKVAEFMQRVAQEFGLRILPEESPGYWRDRWFRILQGRLGGST